MIDNSAYSSFACDVIYVSLGYPKFILCEVIELDLLFPGFVSKIQYHEYDQWQL